MNSRLSIDENKINNNLTGFDFKKLKSFLKIINIKKDKSIIKIFIKDIDEPAIIDIGIKENKNKKKLFILLFDTIKIF